MSAWLGFQSTKLTDNWEDEGSQSCFSGKEFITQRWISYIEWYITLAEDRIISPTMKTAFLKVFLQVLLKSAMASANILILFWMLNYFTVIFFFFFLFFACSEIYLFIIQTGAIRIKVWRPRKTASRFIFPSGPFAILVHLIVIVY